MSREIEKDVVVTGKRIRQIIGYEISAGPKSPAEDYNITLRYVEYFESDKDGSMLDMKHSIMDRNIGKMLLDENGDVLPDRLKLMEDFMAIFYTEIDKA